MYFGEKASGKIKVWIRDIESMNGKPVQIPGQRAWGGVFFELLGGTSRAEEGVLLNRDRRY